jgi:hypothetical protein
MGIREILSKSFRNRNTYNAKVLGQVETLPVKAVQMFGRFIRQDLQKAHI